MPTAGFSFQPPRTMSKIRLTEPQEDLISRWLSAVETGNPNGDYGRVSILKDNPHGGPQVTYGFHQTTEAGGNLKKLLRNYLAREDKAITSKGIEVLRDFISSPQYRHTSNMTFRNLLKGLGQDPAMQDVQEKFFLEHYMEPAVAWAEKNGFTKALSLLVIYDSFIQSGGILWFLRRRFSAYPPSAEGGNEVDWIKSYTDVRHQWLKHWGDGRSSKSRLLRNSAYRTKALLYEINRGNWDLDQEPMVVNGIKVTTGKKSAIPKLSTCPACGGSGKVAG